MLPYLNKYDIAIYICSSRINHTHLLKLTGDHDISITECFLRLFKIGGQDYERFQVQIPEYEPSVEICGEIARKNNAILSIAHPNFTFKGGISEFEKQVEYYIDRGINAVEINGKATPSWVQAILDVQNKYDLLLTFGSDCHVIGEPDEKHSDFGNLESTKYIEPTILSKNIEQTISRVL